MAAQKRLLLKSASVGSPILTKANLLHLAHSLRKRAKRPRLLPVRAEPVVLAVSLVVASVRVNVKDSAAVVAVATTRQLPAASVV
jgi:acyl-coenzyme A thioesterase PaaI-like protein